MRLTNAGAYAIWRIIDQNPHGQAVAYHNDARETVRILAFTSETIQIRTIRKLILDGALVPIRDGEYLALTRQGYDAFWKTEWSEIYLARFPKPTYRMERADLVACPDIANAY